MTTRARECLEKFKNMPKMMASVLILAQKEHVVYELMDYFKVYDYDELVDKIISNTYTYSEIHKAGSFDKFCQNEYNYTLRTTLWFELTVLEKYGIKYVRKLLKHYLKDNYSDFDLLFELNLVLRHKWLYYQDLKNEELSKFYFNTYDNVSIWELRKYHKEYFKRLCV